MSYRHFEMLDERAFQHCGDKRIRLYKGNFFKEVGKGFESAGRAVGKTVESIGQGVAKGDIGSIATAALIVTAAVNPGFLIMMAGEIGAAVGAGVATSTTAIMAGGAVMGGTVGALSGTAKGGDAIWKNAVTGAVQTAATVGMAGAGQDLTGLAKAGAVIGKGAASGALSSGTSAALSGKSVGESALRGGAAGGITAGLTYGAQQLGKEIGGYLGSEFGDQTTTSEAGPVKPTGITVGERIGSGLGDIVGRGASQYAKQEIFPTQSTTYSGGSGTASTESGSGGGGGQVLAPAVSTGSSALAQALRTSPASAVGGGGVDPSSSEGPQENVWNVSSLKLKDALGA